MDPSKLNDEQSGLFRAVINSVTSSPYVTLLTVVVVTTMYFYFRKNDNSRDIMEIKLPEPLPKGDLTLEELRRHDGTGPDKRVCIAVKGEIYDVTKGSRFYGPGAPYALLAGHDATRALATWSVDAVKNEWDEHDDLTPSEMSSVDEWLEQFREKYDYVGRLVKSDKKDDDKEK